MKPTVSVLSNLRIAGALVLSDSAEFPEDAQLGSLLFKGASLFAYITLGGLSTWYPIVRNLPASHIHTQGGASLEWIVTHNLDTLDTWYQVQDENGQQVGYSSFERIDVNSFRLTFSEAITGTVLVVGPNTIDVPTIQASLIKVGAGVVIDTDGMLINGVRVLRGNEATTTEVNTIVSTAITSLKDGVSADGDTLSKLRGLIGGIQTMLSVNDVNLDTLQEVIGRIKSDEGLLSALTTSKVSVSDIVNTLDSIATDKPLSAAQGKVLNAAIAALQTKQTTDESVIAGFNGSVTALNGRADTVAATVVAQANTIAGVSSTVAGVQVSVSSLTTVVSTNTTAIAEEVAARVAAITAINTTIAGQSNKQSIRATTTGALTVTAGTARLYPAQTMNMVNLFAAVNTTSTGADIKIDVKKNGVSILDGNLLTISAGQNRSATIDNAAVVLTTDYLTVDIIQVGSVIAGSDLVVTVLFS